MTVATALFGIAPSTTLAPFLSGLGILTTTLAPLFLELGILMTLMTVLVVLVCKQMS
jgi:hypothetical protein